MSLNDSNELDMYEENKKQIILDLLQKYLMRRHIEATNELWKTIESSKNQNSENSMKILMNNMIMFSKNTVNDLRLLETYIQNNNLLSWKCILEENKNHIFGKYKSIVPTDWTRVFNNNSKTDLKNIHVQTDNIKSNTSEISTQTSATVKKNESQSQCQTNKNNATQSNIGENSENKMKNQSTYAAVLKSKSVENNSNKNNRNNSIKSMKNDKREIYNVKTNNCFEKLSPINVDQPNKADQQSTEAPIKMNFSKKTSSKGTNPINPQQKGSQFRRNQSTSTGKRYQKGKTNANFNPRESKFNTEVHSPSLQRDKWQRKSPHFKENSINNFNSNNKNQNYFNFPREFNSNDNKNPKFYHKNNRHFRQNSNNRNKNENLENQHENRNSYYQNNNRKFNSNYKNQNIRNFENDTFGKNLPLILTSLFMQWIQSNYKSNQFTIKKKSFNNYENKKNQSYKTYRKIII